jgi:hypothetical protein
VCPAAPSTPVQILWERSCGEDEWGSGEVGGIVRRAEQDALFDVEADPGLRQQQEKGCDDGKDLELCTPKEWE